MILYLDENDNPAYVAHVAPSEWSYVRDHVRDLGYRLGDDLIIGSERYIQNVCGQLRKRHVPRYPWVWHLYELIPL